MARFIGSKGHTGLAVPAWLLSTAGFAILLGGIASMQSACGGSGVNSPIPPGMGAVGYLAPVACRRFFSFDWFILAFHFFVWFLVAVFLFSRKVHMARSMLTSLLAVAATLLMFTANTWYRVNGVGDELDGTFKKRARTALAGAAIAAAANLMLLMVLGLHDEKDTDRFEKREEMGYRTGHVETTVPATTVPVSATRTTGAPASTATAV
ncbi:hypothetical protein Ndes2526B_g07718 [Nannochloris sp. 'desiccata']